VYVSNSENPPPADVPIATAISAFVGPGGVGAIRFDADGTVVDVTHGYAVVRLTGEQAADVLAEARRYLAGLERRDHAADAAHGQQWLPLDVVSDPAETEVVAELRALDPDALSPRDAQAALYRLRELLSSR
jgi:FMN phosphatase YigB (HAD superfamily)